MKSKGSKGVSKRMIWHKDEIQGVIDLLLSCKTRKEVELIFDRILTTREINDIGRRYKSLILIDQKKSYADIRLATGMSPITVAKLSAKCGFGFSKSSGLERKKKVRSYQPPRRSIRYKKGVKVI